MGGFLAYWQRVVLRAATDASTSLGANPKKVIFGFLSTLATFAIGFSVLGDEVWQKIAWAAVGLIPGSAIFLLSFGIFLMRAPWQIHREQEAKNKENIAAIERAFGEEKRKSDEQVLAAVHDRNEAIKKAAEKPTSVGAIKNHLNQLGLKSRDMLKTGNNNEVDAWFAIVHLIVEKAIRPMRSYLFKEVYLGKDFRRYAEMLVHDPLRLSDDEVNTDFKPEDIATHK